MASLIDQNGMGTMADKAILLCRDVLFLLWPQPPFVEVAARPPAIGVTPEAARNSVDREIVFIAALSCGDIRRPEIARMGETIVTPFRVSNVIISGLIRV